ncbi:hypothetical protein TB2_029673 [Malus domestica]
MAIANLQAQITNLTSQLTQYIERTTMKSVPTCGVSYGHGYPTHQRPQFTANGDAWGYQGYDQPSNNMFSNTYNSNWRDHSNYVGGNLNNSNKMDISSRRKSFIPDWGSFQTGD